MASSRHPRFSPSGSRQARARLPARPPLSMEDAFTLLQAGMASLSTARQASGGKPSATATPEKCAVEMTSASFRSWPEVTADDVTEEPLVASYRQCGPTPRRPVCAPESSGPPSKCCYYCGEKHGKAPCPVRNQVCKSCGKRGHVKKVCWAAKTQDMAINSVTVGGVTAVADTGAQVCVAGPKLMSLLGLRPALLQRRAGIRELARIPLSSLGAAACRISLPSHTTVQDVHFVENVERLYLSCTTCKDLGLIHQDFPNPSAVAAGVGVTDGDAHDVPGRPAAIPMLPLEENVPQLEQTLRQRERQMANHHDRVVADRNVTCSRASLAPGDRVLVQDHQHGRRWNRAGIVIEARDHRQYSYLVRLDGSGRISLRTRQHLRPAPEVPQASNTEDLAPPTPLSPPSPAPRMDGEGRRARRPPRWLKDYVQ
ncbi:hypothetical protein O3P69_018401 [Scylla paramamosain]|uniref:CCHC-type domain-containing protein n=1 Tax=Scylla paramamosain TaxID=85552 RepID=A0AAW0T2R3_SCYPA